MRAPSGNSGYTDLDGDDVSLARFGVRCDTVTPSIANQKQKSRRASGESNTQPKGKKDLSSVMASYLKPRLKKTETPKLIFINLIHFVKFYFQSSSQ